MKIVERIGGIFFATVLTATAASAQVVRQDQERFHRSRPKLFPGVHCTRSGSAAPKEPRAFFKGLTESRLVRWFINSRDLRHDRDEAVSKGVPYGEVKPGSRQRPDGVQVSWQFTDPAKPVADGVVPFIIDWAKLLIRAKVRRKAQS